MGFSSNNRYDAIVVGSGLGGLSCALHLAKRGLHVLTLEKQPRVGGYTQSFLREGHYFDVSQHVLSSLGPGHGFTRILEYLQVYDKLEIEPRDPMFAAAFPDKTYELPAGIEPLSNLLKSEFPADRDGIDRYFATIRRMVSENFELFWSGEVDPRTFYPARWFDRSYEELLSEHVTEPKLHGLLGQLWQSTGLPNRLCSANWAVEVAGMHWLTGNYHIRGGGQRLSEVMAETLQEAGGAVLLSSLVERVLIEDRRARGVELASGERFFAPIVVCNANPLQTYFHLVDRELLPRPYAYKLGTLEPSCSLLTLYLGLDRPARELGLEHHSLFVNHDYDNGAAHDLAMAESYDRTDYMVTDYTDPSSVSHPVGRGLVQMLEVAPGAPWTTLDRAAYDEKKARVRDILLEKLARRFPDLVQHVTVCELATPRTMQRVTRNPFGAVYGWAQTPAQADLRRFANKSLFEGLYFAGAWGRGGGGGYMGSVINGRVVSREILQREGIDRPEIVIPQPRLSSRAEPTVTSGEAAPPGAPLVTLAASDLSPEGEVLPHAAVRLAVEATDRHLARQRASLAKQWPSLAAEGELAFAFFNMKLLIIPGAAASPGAPVRVEVELTPTGDGRAEVCVVLSVADSGAPLLKLQGRGLARQRA